MKKKEINTRLQVYDIKGKAVDNVQLDEKLFDGRVNKTLIYEVNRMYEADRRRGTASSKTRSEVSGGGSKPWRQKGTGRARFGSSRNPLWRHGGAAFGPRPRNYEYSMPKKAVRGALLSSLNARLVEEMIKPVQKIDIKEPKTKEFKHFLDNLKIEGTVLVIVDAATDEIKRSSRNLKQVQLKEAKDVNARDVLLNECIVIEKEALEKLYKRLK
jgi:large subunit ribosomal protein L4